MTSEIADLKERINKANSMSMDPDERFAIIDLLRKKIIKRLDERIQLISREDMDLSENRSILLKLYKTKLKELDARIEFIMESNVRNKIELSRSINEMKRDLESKLGIVTTQHKRYRTALGLEEADSSEDELDEELENMKLSDAKVYNNDWSIETPDSSELASKIAAQPKPVFETIREDVINVDTSQLDAMGDKLHSTITQMPINEVVLPADDPVI